MPATGHEWLTGKAIERGKPVVDADDDGFEQHSAAVTADPHLGSWKPEFERQANRLASSVLKQFGDVFHGAPPKPAVYIIDIYWASGGYRSSGASSPIPVAVGSLIQSGGTSHTNARITITTMS